MGRIDGLKALVATAAFAVVLLAFGLNMLVSRIDGESARHEARLVRAGYAAAIGDRLSTVESEAIWDAALQHTDDHVDVGWLETNVASPTDWDTFGAVVTVVGQDDRLVFARERAAKLAPARQAAIALALIPVVARLRAREAATASQRNHPGPPAIADRVSLAATVNVEGRAYAALACRMDSSTGNIARPHARAPILAVLAAVDRYVLPAMKENLLLRNARLTLGAGAAGPASITLDDVGGGHVAILDWLPLRPGTDLLTGAMPGILTSVAILGAAVLLAYRRGSQSARALELSEANAKHLAYHDHLTELPNRRFVNEQVAQAVMNAKRQRRSVALLLIDLDQFKAINDLHGHQFGDELIVEVARRLKAVCRKQDVCARLGGDEFVILSVDCSPDEAMQIAKRAAACIAMPVTLAVATVRVDASIGISLYPSLAKDEHELLRQADLALYQAKDSQNTTYRFHDIEMDRSLQQRLGLEADLRQALRTGAVSVAYQPQFRGEVMTGMEALARWVDPVRGPVSPACFIPLAEACGLVNELGLYVLARAFADAKRWPDLKVAVNLSVVQIKSPDFIPELRHLVEQSAISTAQFELEITESVLIADDACIPQALQTLRAMGFRLALDDFGTGYSSLSYLRRLPVDKIKIDRSFITPLPDDAVSLSLVRTIVDLAHALDLDVIAEGVETPGQRDSLARIGCSAVQGYLTGRPVPAIEIDRLVATMPAPALPGRVALAQGECV